VKEEPPFAIITVVFSPTVRIDRKELRGVWRASGEAFFDEDRVWEDKIYPFRFRLTNTEFDFERPLRFVHKLCANKFRY